MSQVEKKTHPVDVHVGSRVQARRSFLNISREKLGADLGITYQQVQKYENGSNRITSGRLFEISQILGVSPGWFFEGLPLKPASSCAMQAAGDELVTRNQGEVELLKNYRFLSNRKRIIVGDLTSALVSSAARLQPKNDA